MSTDKKLNKYLAKLKTTHDVKNAKVYINKILKYKHMSDKQSGGGIIDDIVAPIKKLVGVTGKVDDLNTSLSDKDKMAEIVSGLQKPSVNGYTEAELKDGLKPSLENVSKLLESVGELDPNAIPDINKISDALTDAMKRLPAGETLDKKSIEDIVQDVWSNLIGTTEMAPAEVPVEAQQEVPEEVQEVPEIAPQEAPNA